jgi:hypothetical protein
MKNLILLVFLYSNLLIGQQITFNVQSNFGYKYLNITNILPTDSCYYINGVITDSTNQQLNFGSLFLKLNLNGDTIVTKKLVAQSKDYLTWNTGILTTPDGNLATAGDSDDTVENVFFMKYTQNGDTLLTKEYLNPNNPTGILIASIDLRRHEHGYYLTTTFLPSEDNVKNQTMILKLDESGNLLQQKTYGSNMTELVGSTLVEPDGGLIVGAWRTNDNYVLKNFTSRTYIFKVDSLGNKEWEYLSPSGQLRGSAKSMVKTSDGGLVVVSNKGIEHEVNAGINVLLWQGYVFKLNANHQLVWGRELRGTRYSGGTGLIKILEATDGTGFVAYGNVLEDHSVGTEQYGSWFVKVSNQGDSLWARYYTFFDGHDRSPRPEDFKATPDGGYIVSGHTEEGLENFGWLMKLDSFGCLIPGCNANDGPNATTEDPKGAGKAETKLAIFPNPTTDFLNFELRAPQLPKAASFRILDAGGRLVKEYRTDNPRDTFIVPVREWAAGVYYLQYVDSGEVRAVEKFVVTKR